MHYIDFSIVLIYLTIIFCVGFYTRKYVNNFDGFMIAGRNINLSLAVVTMLGTELGLITVMYNAQAGVKGLFSSFHIGLAAFIATLAIGVTGFVVVELRKLKVKSIPEYYKIRFGEKTRIIGAILLSLGGILNMGLFLKVGAIFIQTIFQLDNNENMLLLIMAVLLALVLVYTVLGGMISVIVTDYIQYIILSIGFMVSVFYSLKILGWSEIFNGVERIVEYKTLIQTGTPSNNLSGIYNPLISSGPSYISWQLILGFVSAVVWPTAITRVLSIKKIDMVKTHYLWSSFSFLIRFIIPCFLGICAFVYFDGNINNDNTLSMLPQYLLEILPVGLLGLVVAGMLAAFMSTHDSYLLCWSTIITNDIVEPLLGRKISSDRKISISRMIILILGLYIFIWGMFYNGSDAIWDYLGITGAVYFTGAISVLVFGLYWPRASSRGAILSLSGGFSAIIGLEPVRLFLGINISNPAIIGLSTLVFSILLMVFGSILFPDKEENN